MQEYNGWDRVGNFNDYSVKRIYDVQLAREGVDIEIEGIKTRGIIRNDFNPYSDKKEERKLIVWKDINVNLGNYIVMDNENYMVISDVDKTGYEKDCKIIKCNQVLKWKDINNIIHEYHCVISNDSYGSKTSSNNDFLTDIDTKMKIQVQYNENTKKINRDMRFIFNKSKFDIFKCVDITTSVANGIMTLICRKDMVKNEDDVENNLAFNEENRLENNLSSNYKIIGDSRISVNETNEYVVNAEGEIEWVLNDDAICKVNKVDENKCNITALKADELNLLIALKDGDKIAELEIETMR